MIPLEAEKSPDSKTVLHARAKLFYKKENLIIKYYIFDLCKILFRLLFHISGVLGFWGFKYIG